MSPSHRTRITQSLRAWHLLPSVSTHRRVVDSFEDVPEARIVPSPIASRSPRFVEAKTVQPEPFRYFDELVNHPIPSREMRVVITPNARLVGDGGAVVTSDGALVRETLWDDEQYWRDFAKPDKIPPAEIVTGRAASLLSTWNSNYYHFLVDALPRLAVLDTIELDDSVRFVVPESLVPWQRQMLQRLDIPDHRLVACRGEHVQVEELVWASAPAHVGFVTPFVVEWLQRRLGRGEPVSSERRLYISRRGSRELENEADVLKVLGHHGFEAVRPELLSFGEQARLFSEARYVVGAHGAGLANAVFAKRLTLLELFQPGFFNPPYFTMAGAADWEYWYLVCGSSDGRGSTKAKQLRVPIDELDRTLVEMLRS